jgi:hypothetical protein
METIHNQPKSMGELAKAHWPNSLTGKLTGINNKIAFAKELPKKELSLSELRRQISIICVTCGIKDLPEEEVVLLCLKMWKDKYCLRMNLKEMELAFELNLSGDLDEKVNHYLCFSVEFFCSVLNRYLEKKAILAARQQLPEPEQEKQSLSTNDILQEIIADFKALVTETEYQNHFPLAARLNLLAQLVEIDVTEKTIQQLRVTAKGNIIRQLCSKRAMLQHNENKFGAILSYGHQIARLEAGTLLTTEDENRLQAEVSMLLYQNTLLHWKPVGNETPDDCVFVNHIKENITDCG